MTGSFDSVAIQLKWRHCVRNLASQLLSFAMNAIASSTRSVDPLHPVLQAWLAGQTGWLDQIERAMLLRGAHPARTVVVLPYAQLMPLAARLWAQRHPQGFAPRFETTQNWSRSLG